MSSDRVNSPEQLFSKSQQFWSQSLTFKPSTFGSTVKVAENPLDLTPKASSWQGKDEFGHSHSRLQISTVFGRLTTTPGPGQYDPDHEKLSRRVNGPHITLGERQNSRRSVEMERKYTVSDMQADNNYNNNNKSNKKKNKKKKDNNQNNNNSALKSIRISDMRRSLGPGPGSYGSADIDKIGKFDRSPLPLLAPRTETKPRAVITLDTLDIVVNRNKNPGSGFRYGGDYDLSKDPRKVDIRVSIGERRPLLGQREQLNIGPGYYNPQTADPFGQSSSLSPSKKTSLV